MWASDDIVLIMTVGEVTLVAIATEIIHKDGAVSIGEEGPGERPSNYGKKRKRRGQNWNYKNIIIIIIINNVIF